MEFAGTLLWLWTVTALFLSSTQDQSAPQNCSTKQEFTQLSQQLERAVLCGDSVWSGWNSQETAQVLSSISTLAQRLHAHQLTDCEGAEPHRCPAAEAPENGGLLCVTISDRRYCKPLCHHGFDFDFPRLSRVFEECSEQTGFRWNSQYVGGNRLAACNKASLAVAGFKSAYFPKGQSCLQTKANATLLSLAMEQFLRELPRGGHQEEPLSPCLVCGLAH